LARISRSSCAISLAQTVLLGRAAYLFDSWFGTTLAEGEQRILSWQSRSPVFTIIGQRCRRP
jgi:hypothetical protein